MKVVRHPLQGRAKRPCVATLGDFDGVHRGHREILERLTEASLGSGVDPAALVFVSPPCGGKISEQPPITTLRERLQLLAEAGVGLAIVCRLPPTVELGPVMAIVADVLGRLPVSRLLLPASVEMGLPGFVSDQLFDTLRNDCRVPVEVVPPVAVDGQTVCSDRLRSAIRNAEFPLLQRLLGRPYSVTGRVVHGHHRGRSIGVPTANLYSPGILLPPDGVYAVLARVGDRDVAAVANIGFKPTFGDPERSLETHLLDFEADLYGTRLRVRFVQRIRAEKKFDGVDELVEQIRRDIEAVRQITCADE